MNDLLEEFFGIIGFLLILACLCVLVICPFYILFSSPKNITLDSASWGCVQTETFFVSKIARTECVMYVRK